MTDESPLNLAQADSITQYTDQAAWTAALTAGSTTQVETFDDNKINTALQISSCQTLNGGCLPGASAISAIVTGQFTDAVGRLAYNPANGQFAFYNATTFLLPGASYAVGFDVSETPIASAIPTDISVTVNSTAFYPFGGGAPGPTGFPPSSAYTGFVGFVFHAPISSFGFSALGTGAAYELDNIQMVSSTPEPSVLGLAALGLGLFIAFKSRRD